MMASALARLAPSITAPRRLKPRAMLPSWPTKPQVRAAWRSVRRSTSRAADAVALGPRLAFNVVRHGILPSGAAAAATLVREGVADIHWKTFGDAIVRVAQHSGPLLTKLGQILATRGDLLPDAVCRRLEALYSRQRPMTRRQFNATLRMAFPAGLPFRALDADPFAVGSIGQVHRAALPDGKRVMVKLIRPGIWREIQRDLNAAEFLLTSMTQLPIYYWRPSARAGLVHALEDLAAALRSETDLRQEASALEEFGRRFESHPRVRIPVVYREFSSPMALVMEELKGEPLSAVRARAQSDPALARKVADLALQEILKQVFDHGRFHADPHAGNLLVLPDGRLGLIDLGLTGETREPDRKRIAKAVRAFVSGDPDLLSRTLLEFGKLPGDFDYDAFQADVAAVVAAQEGTVIAQVTGRSGEAQDARSAGGANGANGLEALVNDLFKVAYRHGIYVPRSTTLLIKTLVTIEGVARSLNPNLNIVTAALPIVLGSLTPKWLRWGFWRG
jgi:ubiquinone biosynthesis protein